MGDEVALLNNVSPHHRLLELFGESFVLAGALSKSLESRNVARKKKTFAVGDEVLASSGPALNKTRKYAAFRSHFYIPCGVIKIYHLMYKLVSSTGRVICHVIYSLMPVHYAEHVNYLL